MINFFRLAENDMSLVYLEKIFGSMGGLLPGKGDVTMLSTMFATFNAIILAIGALVIVYMTVVGVMATAHEGEFMGKKWNNIWIPIRTVMGVAVLVPTASGYSSLQYVLMWIVIQGVAAADTVWSTALTARSVLGTPYGDVSLPAVGVKSDMLDLFKALVCDSTSRLTYANPSGLSKGGYFCNGNSCNAPEQFNPDATSMQLGPQGVCGTLSYCNAAQVCTPTDKKPNAANSMKCLACQAQLSALSSVIPALSAIADQVANADYNYRDFYYHSFNQPDNPNWKPVYDYCEANSIPKEKCCQPSATTPMQTCQATSTFGGGDADNTGVGLSYQNPSDQAVKNVYWPYFLAPSLTIAPSSSGVASDFLSAITDQYMGELTAAYSKYIQIAAQTQSGYDDAKISVMGVEIPAGALFQQADDLGWVFGGVFYYIVATDGGGPSKIGDAIPDLGVDTSQMQTTLANYRTNVSAADALVNAAEKAAEASSNPQATSFKMTFAKNVPWPAKLVAIIFQESFNGLNEILSKVLTATGGPINGLSLLGNVMIWIAVALYAAIFILSITVATVSLVNVYALGTGADSPLTAGAYVMALFVMPLLYLVCGWFIAMGGLMAVYLPLIPYVVFTFGAIGWFIAVIEMMVAAPLVALGILSPSGQHELMGKAEPAILMMLNIFLRPSLMLFGMIAAMLLAVVVVEFIMNTFGLVIVFSSGGAALANPIVLVLFLTSMVTLIVSALNKCFAMIHIIPQQVMQWIGGHHMPGTSGADEALLGEIKGGVKSGTGAVSGGAEKSIKGAAESKQKKIDQAKKAQSAVVSAAEGVATGGTKTAFDAATNTKKD